MTEMFSQYDQRQQAQSAPGWFVTHSAELCLFSSQTFLHQDDVQEKIISAHQRHYACPNRDCVCRDLPLTLKFLEDGWMDSCSFMCGKHPKHFLPPDRFFFQVTLKQM